MAITPSSANFSEAAKKLHEIRGEVLVGILLLPIALAFQNLVEFLLCPTDPPCQNLSYYSQHWLELIDLFINLAILFSLWIWQILGMSFFVLNWGIRSLSNIFISILLTVVFVISITLTGFYPTEPQVYKVVTGISVSVAFFSLFLIDWEESDDLLVIQMFLFAASIYIVEVNFKLS